MRRALLAGGIGGAAMAAALIPFTPTASQAATATIGGYDLGGFAAPITIQFYEPAIPVPNEPQGELHYSFTSATSASGPFASSLSSSVYPGPTLATGLPAFDPRLPQYPIIVTAAYPGTAAEGHQEKTAGPTGIGMVADAKEAKAYGSAQTGTPGPAEGFMHFGNAASTMTVTQTPTLVTSTAIATVHDLGIGTGIIKVASVSSQSKTTSNGTKATATGSVTVTGVTVAGVPFSIAQDGAHGPAKLNLPLPGSPKSGADLLKKLGIEFTPPKVTTTLDGASGQRAVQGLVISIDTAPFKTGLNNLGVQTLIRKLVPDNICVPDKGQLPFGSCLHQEVDAVLNLQPKLVVIAGGTFSASNSSEPFVFNPPPPTTFPPPLTTTTPGLTGTSGTPGTSGTAGTPGTGGVQGPSVAPTNAASQFPLGFNGLKGATMLGLLVGLVSWYGIRNLGLGVIAGFAGCEYGAPRSVPDLRRG
jgi:hypothetical protein